MAITLDTDGVKGYGVLANFHGYLVMRLSDYEDAKKHGFETRQDTLIAPDKLWVKIEKELIDDMEKKTDESNTDYIISS